MPVLVQGMAGQLVQADWPPIEVAEATAVLGAFALPGPAGIAWRSPRPMSAAALLRAGGQTVFLKRHHLAVRDPAALAVEHAFGAHLFSRGLQVPRPFVAPGGATTLLRGEYVYELFEPIRGHDLYRDVVSWGPYASPAHARAAGEALGALHEAAEGFALPERSPGVLVNSVALLAAHDVDAALDALLETRPGVAAVVGRARLLTDWRAEVLAPLSAAASKLRTQPRHWGHGDWHPSNLSWSGPGDDARVAGVFDLGLANRTWALHDLAVAVERSAVDWLDLARRGEHVVDHAAADQLLAGYALRRGLEAAERSILAALLPVVHVEYALSELEYFSTVVPSSVNVQAAYDSYLLGHLRFFATPAGARLLGVVAGE